MRVMPDVHAVRPPVCPHCSALSLGRNGRVVLEGHGQRRRDVVVPAYDGGLTFKRISCWSRRFLCNACGRGSTILPEGVLPGCLSSLAAIAVAWFAASTAMGTSESRSSSVCAPRGRGPEGGFHPAVEYAVSMVEAHRDAPPDLRARPRRLAQ